MGALRIGLPLGVAAIVLGVRARRAELSGAAPAMALAAIVLAGRAIGQIVDYTAVAAVI